MLSRLALVVAFAGCGFPDLIVRDGSVSDAMDSPSDQMGADDAPPFATCEQKWLDYAVTFDAPRQIAAEAGQTLWHPFLTPDERTMYFVRGLAPDGNIYVAERTDKSMSFTSWSPVAELNTQYDEHRFALTPDGLHAVLASSRPDTSGGRLFLSSRTTASGPFSAPSAVLTTALNGSPTQYDPLLTDDALRVYFDAPTGTAGKYEIKTAARTAVTANFDPAEVIDFGDANLEYMTPSVSPDQRVIVAAQLGGGSFTMTYMTRAGATGPFSARVPLSVHGATLIVSAALSHDMCTLYFAADAGGGDWGIFSASVEN